MLVVERDGAQDAEQQRAAVLGGPPPHGLEILADVLDRNRDRGLGPDDEVGARALVRELGIDRQRRPQLLGLPLHLLRDGARRECDVERGLLRRRERTIARREPAEPYGRDDRRGHRALALRAEPERQQRAGRHEHGGAHRMDAGERRVAHQPRVGLAVAGGEPAEAREQPAAQPLGQHEQRRQRREPSDGAASCGTRAPRPIPRARRSPRARR